MSDAIDLPLLTPVNITKRQTVRSLLIGTAPAALACFVLRDMPFYVILPATILAYGFSVAGVLGAILLNNHPVQVGWAGALKSQGDLTGEFVGPGDYGLFPGNIESILDVNLKEQTLDPEPFQELAKDDVPVEVDGYFIAKVVPTEEGMMRFITIPDHGMVTLMKLFESEVRKFISQWNRATDIIGLRDLISVFLELPGKSDPDFAARRDELLAVLQPMTGDGRDKLLTQAGLNNIMEAAGEFCRYAAHWGIDVTEIHLEKVDLPSELKDAAKRRAAVQFDLDTKGITQARRLKMIAEMKRRFPKVPDIDIRDSVDQLLGIAINRKREDVNIQGLKFPSGGGIPPGFNQVLSAIANVKEGTK